MAKILSKEEIKQRIKVLRKQMWKNLSSKEWNTEHQLLDKIYNEEIIRLEWMLTDNY